jgi:hypothetical protein
MRGRQHGCLAQCSCRLPIASAGRKPSYSRTASYSPLLPLSHSSSSPISTINNIHGQQHPHQTFGELMSQCFGQFDHILTIGSYDGITHHSDTHSDSCHLFGPSCRYAKAPSPTCIPYQQDALLMTHPRIRRQTQVSSEKRFQLALGGVFRQVYKWGAAIGLGLISMGTYVYPSSLHKFTNCCDSGKGNGTICVAGSRTILIPFFRGLRASMKLNQRA